MKRNEKLRNLRKALGYTQTSFALLLGVPRTQITMYETGERVPSVSFLLTLKEKCNVSYEWLGEWACELAEQKRTTCTND